MLILLDGIDGSGKSTIINEWKKYISETGSGIFDLKKYWQENKKHPELSEVKAYDFIFCCEPTYAPAGRVIREELIKGQSSYPAMAIAEAYSLDRLILYTKLLIPLLQDGRCIIQDRSVSTSLVYQPLQDAGLTMEQVAALPGNKLALQNPPDHFVVLDIKPETAMARLSERMDKKDDAIFEKLEFLKKAQAKFHSDDYLRIFTERGAKIHYLSAESKIDIMREDAIKLLKSILNA